MSASVGLAFIVGHAPSGASVAGAIQVMRKDLTALRGVALAGWTRATASGLTLIGFAAGRAGS